MRRPEIREVYRVWMNHVEDVHPEEAEKFKKMYKRYAI